MLTMTIGHLTYAVTVRPSGVLLEKPGGAVYEVRPESDPAKSCRGGWACDCGDFMHRHRGTGSDGCKHVRAVVELGLLATLTGRVVRP